MITFDLNDFLDILSTYNSKIWPLQIVTVVMGLIAVILAFRKTKYSDKIILVILSLFWLWNGVVFCFLFWTSIYKLAYIFSVLFLLQGIIFILAIVRNDLVFHFHQGWQSVLGIVFIAYSILGYQVFGYFLGHIYPQFFPFGLVPCPTAIFTFGMFLLTSQKIPVLYLIIQQQVVLVTVKGPVFGLAV